MILVTGATGHSGRELIPELLAAGQPIRVLVRDEKKVAHLDSSIERTIGEMVQVISKVLGKPIQYMDIPPIAAKLFMLKTGMDKTLVNALMEMLASLRKNEGALVTDTFQQLTGIPPRTFEAWCLEHAHAFQNG